VCRPKHVEQLRNIGIINSTTRLHLFGSFYKIYITMHGSMTHQTERQAGTVTVYSDDQTNHTKRPTFCGHNAHLGAFKKQTREVTIGSVLLSASDNSTPLTSTCVTMTLRNSTDICRPSDCGYNRTNVKHTSHADRQTHAL
jgi:hypothetical protein